MSSGKGLKPSHICNFLMFIIIIVFHNYVVSWTDYPDVQIECDKLFI